MKERFLKDYYKILGIPRNANDNEITRAYRKIAVNFHPDKNSDEKAEEKFRESTEAYHFLRDQKKRKDYDSQFKPTPIIKHRGNDLRITLKTKIEDFINGLIRKIVTNRKGLCTSCNGTGSQIKEIINCPKCNGKGIEIISWVLKSKKSCNFCRGSGKIPKLPLCKICSGSGLITEKITRDIQLNPFMMNPVTLRGCGNYAFMGNPGDLIVDFDIQKSSLYQINGLNISRVLIISPAQAILGDIIFLDIFGKKEEVYIPPGTQSGHLIEKENGGIVWQKRKGNLQIRIRVRIPENISQEERECYRTILKIEKRKFQ